MGSVRDAGGAMRSIAPPALVGSGFSPRASAATLPMPARSITMHDDDDTFERTERMSPMIKKLLVAIDDSAAAASAVAAAEQLALQVDAAVVLAHVIDVSSFATSDTAHRFPPT